MFIITYQSTGKKSLQTDWVQSHKLSHNIVNFSGHSVVFKLYIVMFIVYVFFICHLERLNFRTLRDHDNCQNSSCGEMAKTQTTRRFAIVNGEDINKIVDNAIPKNTKRGT